MKNKDDFTIHFVGIKGVGMTALALLVREAGFPVTGSDTPETFITDDALKKASIVCFDSFTEDHVKKAKLVITTGAHGGFSNPEAVAAKANGITVWTQGEAVGRFMDGTLIASSPYVGISITGTHGKTTTTAMLATVFSHLKLDPCYVIGTSSIPSLPGPGKFGKGKYFIAEADEYFAEPQSDKTAKMLYQHPKIAIITSIELDHPDIYPDLASVVDVFADFVGSIPSDGVLIACGDDENVRSVLTRASCPVKTYGFSPRNDFVITRVFVSGRQTFFWIKGMGTDLGEIRINVSGEHNSLNALACVVAGLELGLDLAHIKTAISTYKGSKRRMEFIRETKSGAKLYDDYAHHPSEIIATLKAFRQMFPRDRITCIFQPHTYSRTQKLFDHFIHSFANADRVILLDIFASARETKTDDVSTLHLKQAMERTHKSVEYAKSIEDAKVLLSQDILSDRDIVITMGAGDVYRIHDLLKTI
ncbi:MAG: UDP-N-acetylmuramate--L-alanine ligase [bacterium]|nr:UDP-N-acetylmuramate--L-alanine ligase [bacterium]